MFDRIQPQASTPDTVGPDDVLDVLIVGAGFAGICVAKNLLERGLSNFKIYEKSEGIGGTWWENTYPGAACDIPSHLYCYSFEPNPNWSRKYSPQREIQAYLERCADKYGVRPHIENGRRIVAFHFDDESGLWRAQFEDGGAVRCRHVINGSGGLHEPLYPDIPGLDTFAGPSMHSARWDHSVEMSGKRVAVIGSAASAIQIVPQLAKVVDRLSLFQRTPNYIAPRNDRVYSFREKRRFRRRPWWLKFYRWLLFMRLELLLFPIVKGQSWLGRRAAGRIKDFMRSSVEDRELWPKLEPGYPLGCKRILISDDFYPALNRDNVEVVTEPIDRIEARGVLTADGTLHEVDALVLATGFDLEKHYLSIDVVGPGGVRLSDVWADGAEAYRGVCVAGFPNFYLVTGPNTGVGTTSVVFMIEVATDYILQCLEKAGADQLLSVKPEAMKRYNERLQRDLERTVWAADCRSWYKRADGKITTLYPRDARTFRRELERVNFSDLEVVPTRASTAVR